jgi:hypothetical protein
MAKDVIALVPAPLDEAVSEQDYETLYAVLSASTRGRAFLAEVERRARTTDTKTLLAAFKRLEDMVAAQQATAAPVAAAPAPPPPPPPPPAAIIDAPAEAPRGIPEVDWFAEPPAQAPAHDPLALLMALSEEERIALFT